MVSTEEDSVASLSVRDWPASGVRCGAGLGPGCVGHNSDVHFLERSDENKSTTDHNRAMN